VRKADNLSPSCAVVTKSGKLKFLEPSGPLLACNGTPLPLQTNSGYVIIIVCPLQQWLHERNSEVGYAFIASIVKI